jgi:hypothetical protein
MKHKLWIFEPKPLAQFAGPAHATGYIVDQLVPKSLITQFNGIHKGGKTTFLSKLLQVLATGGTFCGLTVQKTTTLVLTEEMETIWEDRLKAMSLPAEIMGQSTPFDSKPTIERWTRFLEEAVAPWCQDNGVGLVILDTLAGLGPAEKESDNSEVAKYMAPLRCLNKLGIAVLVCHHHGWEGEHSRGASALPGYVDVIIDMYRDPRLNKKTRRRKVQVEGRLRNMLDEMTIELSADGSSYDVVETTHTSPPIKQTIEAILDSLAPPSDGWTIEGILAHWPGASKPGAKSLQNKVVQAGWQKVQGTGNKKTPARYYRPIAPSLPTP